MSDTAWVLLLLYTVVIALAVGAIAHGLYDEKKRRRSADAIAMENLRKRIKDMSAQLDALKASLQSANDSIAIIGPAVTALQNRPAGDDLTEVNATAATVASGLQAIAAQLTPPPAVDPNAPAVDPNATTVTGDVTVVPGPTA